MTIKTGCGVDVIGDIHGRYAALTGLMTLLGYENLGDVWRHPAGRKALFLGDLIDRGENSRAVIALVRAMAENGEALCLMGNHELNAVHFSSSDQWYGREHLRPHTEKNIKQHQSFLAEYGLLTQDGAIRSVEDNEEYARDIEWFRALPLYCEVEGLRAVHAAWIENAVERIGEHVCDRRVMHAESWPVSADYDGQLFQDVETILKGPEEDLPACIPYMDKDGNPRRRARIAWWREGDCWVTRTACSPDTADALRDTPGAPVFSYVYPADAPPVFFGHYWMTPEEGAAQLGGARNTMCLDFSIGKGAGGGLAAYRWDGEDRLDAARLFVCDAGGMPMRIGAARFGQSGS